MKLGTVIATSEGPSTTQFSFVMGSPSRQGDFVSIKTKDGNLLAVIDAVVKSNKYFESAGAVQEYSRSSAVHTAFPVKEWEHTIAECRTLGVYKDNARHTDRPNYPPAPGAEVGPVDPELLDQFLGFDQEDGLHFGKVYGKDLAAKIRLGNLVKRHMAILAISGAGKSYTMSVLLEELLNRKKEQGRVAVFVVDNHGEYTYLKGTEFGKDVEVVDAKDVKISISTFNAWAFRRLLPGISAVQQRELEEVLIELKNSGENYDLDVVIGAIRKKEIKANVKDPLLGQLSQMKGMGLFSTTDFPNIQAKMRPGKIFIVNLKSLIDNRKKQIIVDHFSRKLFYLRRESKVPPYLEIIEEAHNFCPSDTSSEEAVARPIIRTLAREGRKFNANICLISQRPVQLDTTALSQCNSQIIMRITNPFDLDQIKKSSEAISSSTLNMISGLRVGEAYVIGAAVNHPVLIKIRERKADPGTDKSLEDEAREYEEQSKGLASGEDFI